MRYIITVQGHSRTYMQMADTKDEVNRKVEIILKNHPKSIIIISEYLRTITTHARNLLSHEN
jgi:triosephosphate isomerase